MKKGIIEELKGVIFVASDGIFEAYYKNNKTNKIGGYKLFATHGENNPCREFDINSVNVANLRE